MYALGRSHVGEVFMCRPITLRPPPRRRPCRGPLPAVGDPFCFPICLASGLKIRCSCQVAKALASEKQIRFAPFADGRLTEVTGWMVWSLKHGEGAGVSRLPRAIRSCGIFEGKLEFDCEEFQRSYDTRRRKRTRFCGWSPGCGRHRAGGLQLPQHGG